MNAGSERPSNASRPLWAIAVALSVIAACLLLFLVQEQSRSKQTEELPSPEAIPHESAADLSKPAPKFQSRPLIRTLHSKPAATASTAVAEAELADSLSANAEPVASLPSGAAIPPQRGGYAPLTGQSQTVFGEITGRVSLKGTPPPEVKITLDATCGKLLTTPVTTRHYVVGTDGGLANVFVYIKKGLEGRRFAPPKETPVLDLIDCFYEPYVVGVMTSQKLKVKNSDSLLHNIHSTPKVAGNNEENKALRGKDETEFFFRKQEILVRFKCDVHPWEFAYVGVVEHPFFAVTDKAGSFTLINVPPGNYVLEAYHLKTHGANPGFLQEVSVKRGEAAVADFTIELPAQ